MTILERLTRSPLLLGLLVLVSAAIGGGVVASTQWVRPVQGSGSDVRAYLLANPEVIPEAIDQLRRNDAAKVVDENSDAIFKPFPGAVGGNPNGTVPVAVYMDYACGYCRASLPIIDRLVAENPDVKIVYHELPILTRDRDPDISRLAAEWSMAAAEQGKFKAYHDRLFAEGQLSSEAIDRTIDAAGLNRTRGQQVVTSAAANQAIETNLALSQQLGGAGTPTWVIGDRVIPGAIPYEAMLDAVNDARKKS